MSVTGTWILNENLSYNLGDLSENVKSNITANFYDADAGEIVTANLNSIRFKANSVEFLNNGNYAIMENFFYSEQITTLYNQISEDAFTYSSAEGIKLRTLTIHEDVEFYGTSLTPTIFADWLKANATKEGEIPAPPETPTKQFIRLYKGYTVAKSGTKIFKRLTTEEAVGTYLLNETLSALPPNKELTSNSYYYCYKIDGYLQRNNYKFNQIGHRRVWSAVAIGDRISIGTNAGYDTTGHYRYYSNASADPDSISGYSLSADSIRWGNSATYVYDKNSDIGIQLRLLTITGGDDINDERFISWLKANTTKQ